MGDQPGAGSSSGFTNVVVVFAPQRLSWGPSAGRVAPCRAASVYAALRAMRASRASSWNAGSRGGGMSAPETRTVGPGLTVGPTSEFSLFFRVKPGEGEGLRAALRDLQGTPGYRPGDYGLAIATIHEARFVLFDDDTRLAFMTSFDGSWDAYMDDFFTSGPTLALFDAVFQHVEGYEGLPDLQAVKAFVLGAQVTAAAYARNYGGTVKEIRKGSRVNDAFQRVLDDPKAGEALQHPALKPLLDEAAD